MKQSLPIFLLVLVLSLSGGCTTERERQQMAQVIAEADSMNRNYVPMTSDSLLLQACEFYDRHGSPNERMKAHYLLGCVYRDLGEAPHAIDCYQQAADCADTTQTDCDFKQLARVHCQTAELFYQQLLPNEMLEELEQARKHALLGHDTITALIAYERQSSAYSLLNQQDSATSIIEKTYQLYLNYGYDDLAANAASTLFVYLVEQKNWEKAKVFMDIYEQQSDFFQNGEILPGRELFYYYKGCYYAGIGLKDSAQYYFRKELALAQDANNQEAAYKGLYDLYKTTGITDSVAKYADLCYATSEEQYEQSTTEELRHMQALYNYSRQQKIAEEQAEKARAESRKKKILMGVVLLLIAAAFYFRRRYMEKKHTLDKLKSEFAEATDRYDKNLQTLQALEDDHRAMIAQVKDELSEENARLKAKIEELVSQSGISSSVRKMQSFMESPIARRLMELRDKPLSPMTEQDKEMLVDTTRQFYPSFLYDLQHAKNITPTGVCVGILSAMNFRSGDIANLLDLSFQQVSNIKKSISLALFNEKTARSLYMNLVKHYDFYQTSML